MQGIFRPRRSGFKGLSFILWKDLNKWFVRDDASSSACKRTVDLYSLCLSPRHIKLTFFSDLVDENTK